MERVGRVAGVGRRVGERTEHVEKFDERPGPAVGQEERGYAGIGGADVEEVKAFAGDGCQELRPGFIKAQRDRQSYVLSQ